MLSAFSTASPSKASRSLTFKEKFDKALEGLNSPGPRGTRLGKSKENSTHNLDLSDVLIRAIAAGNEITRLTPLMSKYNWPTIDRPDSRRLFSSIPERKLSYITNIFEDCTYAIRLLSDQLTSAENELHDQTNMLELLLNQLDEIKPELDQSEGFSPLATSSGSKLSPRGRQMPSELPASVVRAQSVRGRRMSMGM